MARNRKPTPTKTVIVKIASELFFENGFTKTTSTEICKKADISPGNLTFYFPNKESILATLVQMMIDFQWKEMEAQTDEGKSSLLAYCLELTTLVALSEEIPQMQDFLFAAYSHPTTLDLIRINDTEKIKQVFTEYTVGFPSKFFPVRKRAGVSSAFCSTGCSRTSFPAWARCLCLRIFTKN